MILYLMHGWMILAVLPSLVAVLPPGVVTLLVGGGIVYALGTLVHTRRDWPLHNAAWHAMVLVAACLHCKRPANAFAGAATRFRVGVLTHLPGCARLSPDRIVLS
jgi:hypothetical protein